MLKIRNRAARIGAVVGVALLALTGCTSGSGGNMETSEEPPAAQVREADSITVEDAWVKSAAQGEMTSAFGTLDNSSGQAATVVSATSSATSTLELHETVPGDSGQGTMREVEGGFVIPANDHLHLDPGGNHLMLMDLPAALQAGEEVAFTLTFADGSTLEFTAIVKDYAGANESYEGESDHDHSDHDHDEHDDHDEH